MAVFCMAIGLPAALHLVRPTSLAALLPDLFVQVYGIVLVLAGVTIAIGLRHGSPRWPVCTGLNALGLAVAAYAVAIIGNLGIGGLASGGLFIAVALLCWLRAFTITTSLRERARVARESGHG